MPEELIRKSWSVCGYKSVNKLEELDGAVSTLTEYSASDLVGIIEAAVGGEAVAHWKNPENENIDAEEEEEEGSWIIGGEE